MKRFMYSFFYAFNGLRICFFSETNFRVHLLAALAVSIAGWWLDIERFEWLIVMGCIAMVMMAELINTALEQLCNLVSPGYNPVVRKVKDMSAAAVLVAAFMSLVCAVVIFMPHLSDKIF